MRIYYNPEGIRKNFHFWDNIEKKKIFEQKQHPLVKSLYNFKGKNEKNHEVNQN